MTSLLHYVKVEQIPLLYKWSSVLKLYKILEEMKKIKYDLNFMPVFHSFQNHKSLAVLQMNRSNSLIWYSLVYRLKFIWVISHFLHIDCTWKWDEMYSFKTTARKEMCSIGTHFSNKSTTTHFLPHTTFGPQLCHSIKPDWSSSGLLTLINHSSNSIIVAVTTFTCTLIFSHSIKVKLDQWRHLWSRKFYF